MYIYTIFPQIYFYSFNLKKSLNKNIFIYISFYNITLTSTYIYRIELFTVRCSAYSLS